MSRPCSACAHRASEAIAAALGRGETLRSVSGTYGISISALSRHSQHARQALVLVDATGEADRAPALDIIERWQELRFLTQRVQLSAGNAGNARLMLEAIREESSILNKLCERTGISPEALADDLAAAGAMRNAVGHFLLNNPKTQALFADRLEAEIGQHTRPAAAAALRLTVLGLREHSRELSTTLNEGR